MNDKKFGSRESLRNTIYMNNNSHKITNESKYKMSLGNL